MDPRDASLPWSIDESVAQGLPILLHLIRGSGRFRFSALVASGSSTWSLPDSRLGRAMQRLFNSKKATGRIRKLKPEQCFYTFIESH